MLPLRGRLAALVAAAGLAASAVGCKGGEVAGDIDGGAFDVALLRDLEIAVRPGETVVLRHAGESVAEAEAPILHAFIGPEEELPPLFVPQAGGLVPAPAVWNVCRGGAAEETEGVCPMPLAEGPAAWDGRSYWSTGALAPSETRAIPLADDISEGDHILTCALHPTLRVMFRVGGEAASHTAAAAGEVEAARAAVEDDARGSHVTVTAGLTVGEAYVAAFSPRIVRVPVGGSVTWRAGARAPVDVVFGISVDQRDRNPLSLVRTVPTDGMPAGAADAWDGRGELRSGFLSADSSAGAAAQEWTVTFTRPGTYAYASRFGDAMVGTVIVEEAGA